ncbi:Gfo/Idh/MocA family oxidoreductase [Kineococcus sp. LSe6-4]|uniref:Gfo/Idh/MocA family oxidoreductase n=1 Tax=Kineococcus halophytocola TaxID=3234027 RepID=A0ABV4GW07_9ACTN
MSAFEGGKSVFRAAPGVCVRATIDAFEAIAAADVDAVVIASPTPTHVDLLAAALETGKAVPCEKPIDLDLTRVDAVRECARAASTPVVLGFNRRFDPHFAELRRGRTTCGSPAGSSAT